VTVGQVDAEPAADRREVSMNRSALCSLVVFSGAACRYDNPPTTREIEWDSPRTEELARRACYDCHSNETHWYATAYLPIIGSIITHDVHKARCEMNFSEWDGPQAEAEEAPEAIREGEMPLGLYRWAHKDARLTDAEAEELAAGFERTFAADPPLSGEACGGDDDDDADEADEAVDSTAARGRSIFTHGRRARAGGATADPAGLAVAAVVVAWAHAGAERPFVGELDGERVSGTWRAGAGSCALSLRGGDQAFTATSCVQEETGWRAEGHHGDVEVTWMVTTDASTLTLRDGDGLRRIDARFWDAADAVSGVGRGTARHRR
jgi:hypothetical protein